MITLALDTTTSTGSIALVCEGELLDCFVGDGKLTHGERLPGDILALLEKNSKTFADVELYAVCSGPGSFTGLRVGLATIQALSFVNKKPAIAIPALEAYGYAVMTSWPSKSEAKFIGTWMNAHRNEVFAALYEKPSTFEPWPVLTETVSPSVGEAGKIIDLWLDAVGDKDIVIGGDAVASSAKFLKKALGVGTQLIEEAPPLAPIIGKVGETHFLTHGTGQSNGILPIYIRRPDVEIAKEKRLKKQGN